MVNDHYTIRLGYLVYIICKGPKLDAYRFQSVMPANCRYDSIRQHEWFFQVKKIFSLWHLEQHIRDTLDESLVF